MLEWTQGDAGARLMALVHHDDSEREWAYGVESKIGTFSDAHMAEATKSGRVVISMKKDWKVIFTYENIVRLSLSKSFRNPPIDLQKGLCRSPRSFKKL